MRTRTEVDRARVEELIAEAEAAGPLANRSRLHEYVANRLDINPVVVMLRIKEWGLTVKTPVGRRGRAAGSPPPPRRAPPARLVDPPVKKHDRGAHRLARDTETSSDPVVVRHGLRTTITPAGSCPVKLTGYSYSDVAQWCQSVQDYGIRKGINYTPSALRYWLREFADINGPNDRAEIRVLESHVEMFALNQSGELEEALS